MKPSHFVKLGNEYYRCRVDKKTASREILLHGEWVPVSMLTAWLYEHNRKAYFDCVDVGAKKVGVMVEEDSD